MTIGCRPEGTDPDPGVDGHAATGLVPRWPVDGTLEPGSTGLGREGTTGAGDMRLNSCCTFVGTGWYCTCIGGGGGGGVLLQRGGGGGGGSPNSLGEYCRLTCGCDTNSDMRGLSERELPAPLSKAGLPRWRFSSRSKLGFRINLLL